MIILCIHCAKLDIIIYLVRYRWAFGFWSKVRIRLVQESLDAVVHNIGPLLYCLFGWNNCLQSCCHHTRHRTNAYKRFELTPRGCLHFFCFLLVASALINLDHKPKVAHRSKIEYLICSFRFDILAVNLARKCPPTILPQETNSPMMVTLQPRSQPFTMKEKTLELHVETYHQLHS